MPRITLPDGKVLSFDAPVDLGYCDDVVVINEFIVDPDGSDGGYEWMELYNPGSTSVVLDGWTLADGGQDTWTFPDGTALGAGEFLLIWCDEDLDQGTMHAAVKLSSGGEPLTLTDANGVVQDAVEFPTQVADVSWARVPDGDETWQTLAPPTPEAPNG